jgi:hypothetical protein
LQPGSEAYFRLQFLWNGTHHVDSADVHNARGDDNHKIGIPSRHNFDGVFRRLQDVGSIAWRFR